MKLMDIYSEKEKYYPNVIKQINGEFYLYPNFPQNYSIQASVV